MRFFVLASVTTVGGILLACSTESTTTNNNTADGGASSSSGGSSSGAASSSGGSSSGSATKPAASTTEGPVTIDTDTCPSFTACGGTLDGTWDYEKGCLGDLFGQFRDQCKTLDTTGLKATVKGSIYFLAAGALERDVTSKVEGTVKFPASCTFGQGCAAAELLLQENFPNVKCTGTTDCSCTASRTESNTAATTYTVTGNTVKTADGDEYDFCVNGSSLTYSGKTKEAESGVWQLEKR